MRWRLKGKAKRRIQGGYRSILAWTEQAVVHTDTKADADRGKCVDKGLTVVYAPQKAGIQAHVMTERW
jgi:hypothetical protein